MKVQQNCSNLSFIGTSSVNFCWFHSKFRQNYSSVNHCRVINCFKLQLISKGEAMFPMITEK